MSRSLEIVLIAPQSTSTKIRYEHWDMMQGQKHRTALPNTGVFPGNSVSVAFLKNFSISGDL